MTEVIVVTKPVTYSEVDKIVAVFDCKSVGLDSVRQAFPKEGGYTVHSPVRAERDVYNYYIPEDDEEGL